MASKSRPVSLRLSERSYDFVREAARSSGRSQSEVVESLAEEAIRTRVFPGIAFREGPPRRAWVIGTGLDVWEIIQSLQDLGSVERLVAETDLEETFARLAVAYYERYPDEIDAMVTRNQRSLEEWQELYPAFGVIDT